MSKISDHTKFKGYLNVLVFSLMQKDDADDEILLDFGYRQNSCEANALTVTIV